MTNFQDEIFFYLFWDIMQWWRIVLMSIIVQLLLSADNLCSLIRVFPDCYFDKHFVNSSPDNRHFIWEQKEKSVQNVQTVTV